MITWRGTGYILLIVVSFIVLATIGYDLLAIILPVLLLLPLLSLIRQILARRSLQVSQRLEPVVIERNGTTRLTVSLRQYGWLSHGEIEMIIKMPDENGRVTHRRLTAALLADTSREFGWMITAHNRGRFRPGLVALRSRDLFGLFTIPVSRRGRLRRSAPELIVLPKSDVLPSIDHLVRFLAKCEIQPNPGIGDEVDAIANIRAWRPGDSMKRTHWKLSARLDQTMIKEYENPIRRSGLLLIDMARPAGMSAYNRKLTDLADTLTDQAASLIKHLLGHENSLRIVAYDSEGRNEVLANKDDDLLTAQMMLADLGWSDPWEADQTLAEETSPDKGSSFVLFFTSRLNDAAMSRLLALHQNGIPVWLIIAQMDSGDEQLQSILEKYKADDCLVTVLNHPAAGEGGNLP